MNILKNKFLAVMIATLGLVTIGAVSINLVVNGNYCNNLICEENLIFNPTPYKLATDVTASTGFTVTRSTDNTANWSFQNIAHWRFQSSTQNAYVEFAKRLPYGPNRVGTCIAGLKFIGDGNGYALRVVNSTGVIVAETKLDFASSYQQVYTPAFSCDVTGERLVRIVRIETGTGATFGGGEVFYGQYKPQFGTIVTAPDHYKWIPIVTNLGAGSGTAYGVAGRVGPNLVGRISFRKDATNGTGASDVRFSLPPNLTGLASGFPDNTSSVVGSAYSNGSTSNITAYFSVPTNTVYLSVGSTSASGSFFTANTLTTLEFSIPIQGWDVGAKLADQYDGQEIIAKYSGVPTGTIGTSFANSGNLTFPTKIFDTIQFFNGTTATIKSPGKYRIKVNTQTNGTATNWATVLYIARNGVMLNYNQQAGSGNAAFGVYDDTHDLLYGDIITVRLAVSGMTSPAFADPTQNRITIEKISGSAFMTPVNDPPVIVFADHTSGTLSINNNTTQPLTGWSELRDTHNAFNPATGLFISPKETCYGLSGKLTTAIANWNQNGEFNSAGNWVFTQAAGSYYLSLPISNVVCLAKDQTLQLTVYQASGGSKSLHTSGNNIRIYEIK